ncbi:MAG: hypothetical protein KGQ60_04745 [Planctomycetes bacterium]|nr:hypothetical protein [Planctomycetota bacterium]
MHLGNQWYEFRRLGCHLIPVNGKDKLIQPVAIAVELGLPFFIVFDADGDTVRPEHRIKHDRDNSALIKLLGQSYNPFPNVPIVSSDHAIWPTNMGAMVKADFGEQYDQLVNAARAKHNHEGGLEKHDLFIADWVTDGRRKGYGSATLQRLCAAILDFARSV